MEQTPTTQLTFDQLRALIEAAAEKHRIKARLIYGLVMTESAGDPCAMRYEPHYRWVVAPETLSATELIGRKTSWGLMQVMGQNLRTLGYMGAWSDLENAPMLQLDYGCQWFVRCIKAHRRPPLDTADDTYSAAVAAYNAGTARYVDNNKGDTFVNQAYVDKVFRWAECWDEAVRVEAQRAAQQAAPTKPWRQSRTIRTNAAVGAATVVAAAVPELRDTLRTALPWWGFAVAIVAFVVANIYLRSITTLPLAMRDQGADR